MKQTDDFFAEVLHCLQLCDPVDKAVSTQALFAGLTESTDYSNMHLQVDLQDPGRPAQPLLVGPKHLPKRSLHTVPGRVVAAHALAHIEFNAINLALDAAYRFRGMPDDYYRDWLRVAAEEAQHFLLLQQLLCERGSYYGAFTAHDGLWVTAQRTAHDVLARMALIPRVFEARGLDVTPAMIAALRTVGDMPFADALQRIYDEEIGHVAIGDRWFRYLCAQRQLPPQVTFLQMIEQHMDGRPRGPFNVAARTQAGFTQADLQDLYALAEQ